MLWGMITDIASVDPPVTVTLEALERGLVLALLVSLSDRDFSDITDDTTRDEFKAVRDHAIEVLSE